MRSFSFIILLTFLSSCANQPIKKSTQKKIPFKKGKIAKSNDTRLKVLAKKQIPRDGEFSTVSEGVVTTERYRRPKGESVFILENGELRTETEKRSGGTTLTRTWQAGIMTSLTYTGSKRTTFVQMNREGHFTQKIVTERGKNIADCYWYEGEKVLKLEDESCLELISGFD